MRDGFSILLLINVFTWCTLSLTYRYRVPVILWKLSEQRNCLGKQRKARIYWSWEVLRSADRTGGLHNNLRIKDRKFCFRLMPFKTFVYNVYYYNTEYYFSKFDNDGTSLTTNNEFFHVAKCDNLFKTNFDGRNSYFYNFSIFSLLSKWVSLYSLIIMPDIV